MAVASLIISIYSNTEALRAVLDSLRCQSRSDFEIIISEDAEHAHVREFIVNYPFAHPITHLTQEDSGWQKNRALNRAVCAARTPYLIFIDGDCVLHPRFIESHLALAERGSIVAGKRVKLNADLSEKLLRDPALIAHFNRLLLPYLWHGKRGVGFLEEGFFVDPRSLLGRFNCRKMSQLKGCNMSFYKADLEAINGFDEAYTLPAIGEDIDLTWRFERAGFSLRSARNLAVQYHLYHKENWTDQSINLAMMRENQACDRYICLKGLNQ